MQVHGTCCPFGQGWEKTSASPITSFMLKITSSASILLAAGSSKVRMKHNCSERRPWWSSLYAKTVSVPLMLFRDSPYARGGGFAPPRRVHRSDWGPTSLSRKRRRTPETLEACQALTFLHVRWPGLKTESNAGPLTAWFLALDEFPLL